MKKSIVYTLVITIMSQLIADDDIHTGQISGDYSGESHVDSVWRDTYIQNGNIVYFSNETSDTNYTRADFSNAILTGAQFVNATLTKANFENANLSSVNFSDAILSKTTFSNATIEGLF